MQHKGNFPPAAHRNTEWCIAACHLHWQGTSGRWGGSVWGAERADGFCSFVELEITRFSLVALSYQLYLNLRSRSYAVYGLTIGTTYHFSGHNSSYLTLN